MVIAILVCSTPGWGASDPTDDRKEIRRILKADDPFVCLGVLPTASEEEVKKAYKQLTAKYHPDRVSKDPARSEYYNRIQVRLNDAYADAQRGIRFPGKRRREWEEKRAREARETPEERRAREAREAQEHFKREYARTRRGYDPDDPYPPFVDERRIKAAYKSGLPGSGFVIELEGLDVSPWTEIPKEQGIDYYWIIDGVAHRLFLQQYEKIGEGKGEWTVLDPRSPDGHVRMQHAPGVLSFHRREANGETTVLSFGRTPVSEIGNNFVFEKARENLGISSFHIHKDAAGSGTLVVVADPVTKWEQAEGDLNNSGTRIYVGKSGAMEEKRVRRAAARWDYELSNGNHLRRMHDPYGPYYVPPVPEGYYRPGETGYVKVPFFDVETQRYWGDVRGGWDGHLVLTDPTKKRVLMDLHPISPQEAERINLRQLLSPANLPAPRTLRVPIELIPPRGGPSESCLRNVIDVLFGASVQSK